MNKIEKEKEKYAEGGGAGNLAERNMQEQNSERLDKHQRTNISTREGNG